jgi:hypothetical protein
VLAIPESLGRAKSDDEPGPRTIQRFDLENQVRPSLSADVRVSGERFEYSYRVANDKAARKPIMRFNVVVPPAAHQYSVGSMSAAGPEEYAMSAPPNWKASAMSTQVTAARASLGVRATSSLDWFKHDPRSVDDPLASAIMPGTALEGFRVMSSRRPGFTTAYFRGSEKLNLPSDLPPVVLEQAAPALTLEFNSQPVITVAPMFEATAPKLVIVADFHAGISRLVANRLLDGDSPAVKEALGILGHYLEVARAVDQELETFTGPSITFKERPRAGFEAEILAAMKLSVGD